MLQRTTLAHFDGERVLRSERGPATAPALVPAEAPLGALTVPALAFDEAGTLWAAFADEAGRVWLGPLAPDGALVEPRYEVRGARTSHRPALTRWHGKHCVALTAGDGSLWLACHAAPAELRLRRAHRMALAQGAPSLAATPARLYLAFAGTDGVVYLASSDDGRRVDYNDVPMARTVAQPPALSAWGPQLALAAVDDQGHVYTASSREPGRLALTLRGGAAVTHASVALALSDSGLLVALAGTDGGLYLAESADPRHALEFAHEPSLGPIEGAPSLACTRDGEPDGPARTVVVPVLFTPSDVRASEQRTETVRASVAAHLALAQARYRAWLETDTFECGPLAVVEGKRPQRAYSGERSFDRVLDEVLVARGDNNTTSVAVYVIFFDRGDQRPPEDCFGAGGTDAYEGAGAVIMELSSVLEDYPYPMQSTLVHELGHAFGLPHVSAYGEDMNECESIMSYNPRHHTRGLGSPEPEAILLAEELASLGGNEVAFPAFEYDPARHNPSGRPLRTPRE